MLYNSLTLELEERILQKSSTVAYYISMLLDDGVYVNIQNLMNKTIDIYKKLFLDGEDCRCRLNFNNV